MRTVKLLAIAVVLVSMSAHAADLDQLRYAGVFYGRAFGLNDNTEDAPVFGGHFGVKVGEDSAGKNYLGLAVFTTPHDTFMGSIVETDRLTTFLAEYIGRRAWGTGLYLGARAGLGTASAELASGGVLYTGSRTGFVVGPVVGFEIPTASNASISIDASWVTMAGGPMTVSGLGTFEMGNVSALAVQIGAQIHW